MKTQDDTIKLLIERMTAAEKRMFKMYASAYHGYKKYLNLFEAIESQKVYDETSLKQKFKGNFPALKKYLFDSLIDSLKISGDYKDLDSYHVHEIEKYKILKHKGLEKASEIQLRRAKKITQEDEGYIKHLYVLIQEYVLVFNKDSNLATSRLNFVIEERNKVIDIITNYTLVSDVYFKLRLALKRIYYCKTTEDIKQLETIIAPIKKYKESDLLSNTSRSMYYMAMNEYYTAIGEYDKALLSSGTYLSLKRAKSGNKIELQTILENANYLLLALKCLKWNNFKEKLEWLETIMATSSQAYRFVFCYERWYVIKLRFYQITGKKNESQQFIKSERKRFVELSDSFALKYKASAHYFNALNYYLENDLKNALANCNHIINSLENGIEEYLYAKILRVFIYTKQENYDTNEYEIRGLIRLIRKEVLERKNEINILKHLAKSPTFEGVEWRNFFNQNKLNFQKDKTLSYYLGNILIK